MAKLGFLGLGLMGYPMAEHLIDAGHQVAVWTNTTAKAKKLADEKGGVFCETPKAVGEFAECIFLCVGNSEMSETVLTGENGVIQGIGKGAVVADCSTIAPSVARKLAAAFEAKGAHYLDSPCTGSTPGAKGGTLTFMVGGSKEVFDRVRPFYDPMGANFYYCGPQGMGLHAKLSQNLVLANMLQGFVEGMVLAAKAGVDPKLMFEILDNSAAKAGLISFKAPQIFKRNFEAAFPLKWMKKDVSLMLDSGRDLGVPLPCTAVVHEMLTAGIASGHGDEDIAAAIKLFEGFAGVEVKG
jgi:3-hydroxyisobutyrate dehydrogenase/2-hydroxy-3-oxopropionate reductase